MPDYDSLTLVKGTRLYVHYVEKDRDRPVIVFLHDSLGCTTLWRDFPEKLSEATGCNMLIYDRKGYGQSDPLSGTCRTKDYLEEEADVLIDLLRQYNIREAILFGHSDGGSIALITAAKYPAAIKAVIAEAAHIYVEKETTDGIRAALRSYKESNLKDRLAKYHGEKTETVFYAWAHTWLSTTFSTWNIEHFLPHIICPVLIIQGEGDEYGTMKQVHGIANGISGSAEICALAGVGHTPHKQAAGETLKKGGEFIGNLPAVYKS